MDQGKIIQWTVTIVFVAIVMALRLRRMTRLRPLKLETLWVIPALIGVALVGAFAAHPPSPLGWLAGAAALAIGAAIGWQRGRLMQIHVDPDTHALNHRASPVAFVLLMAIVAVRQLVRAATPDSGPWGVDPNTVTDASVAFGFGLIAATRLEMWLRARRLVAESRSGRTDRSLREPEPLRPIVREE